MKDGSPASLLQPLDTERVFGCAGNVRILRLDQIDADMPGNKLFKLAPNLELARELNLTTILSFGGQYSNHIHALAAAGNRSGLRTIGIIRSDSRESPDALSPTLQDASKAGMKLVFVSRGEYRRRHEPEYLSSLQVKFGPCLIVPEGGSNLPGIRGCRDIVKIVHQQVEHDYDVLMLPCATGGTLAGILTALPSSKQVIGIAVLKGEKFIERDICAWLEKLRSAEVGDQTSRWALNFDYHGGGYARAGEDLRAFCSKFYERSGISVEPIYTGKLFFALGDMLRSQKLRNDLRIIVVHTGGIQAARIQGEESEVVEKGLIEL